MRVTNDQQAPVRRGNRERRRFRLFRPVGEAAISGLDAEGVQVLGLDDEGKIADLTVFLRPIRAGMALSELMGPKITKLHDGTYGLRASGTDSVRP